MNRTAMAAGNAGKFDTAFKNINQALALTRQLKKRVPDGKTVKQSG